MGFNIKKVYRFLAKKFHPDKCEDETEKNRMTQIMALINSAYAQKDVHALIAYLTANEQDELFEQEQKPVEDAEESMNSSDFDRDARVMSTPEEREQAIWITADNRRYKITEMETRHIQNVLRLLKKRGLTYKRIYLLLQDELNSRGPEFKDSFKVTIRESTYE